MKQEIIRLDQLTMGTIKYSDITLLQEKETEIISSDSLWRGIHGYYNGLVKSNIGNGKKVILQIHSKKEFILLFMALIRTGADGWLCTGDIGFLSGQNLYIVGRKKDMFFMHGKNIYMRDIEQIIFERYGVRSAACGENNAMEEKSKIYLFMELEISSAEYTKKKKEIIMFIQGETGIKLSDVIFKDDMFMTQVGKFSKAELLKKYKKQNCPEVNS